MDFRQLQYLTAVAEHRNVTKAAESLYISQSALSHYIRKAEEELGVQLFDRSTTPISLTYAGTCYIQSAQRILMENQRLMKELREITENMTGVIRIGISRDRASYTMPRLVRDFQARYPGIRVDIFTESGQQLREALKTGRIDLLLLPGDGRDNDPAIAWQKIYTEELVLCAGNGVLQGNGYLENPKTLDHQPFFLLKQEHTIRSFCDGFFRKNRIRPEICNELSSSVTCYRMAASGVGLAIVPYMVTQLAYPGMEMDLFSLGKEPVTWDINMYYRKDAYLSHPEQEMIRLAQKLFSHEMLDHPAGSR